MIEAKAGNFCLGGKSRMYDGDHRALLEGCIERVRAGDASARDELLTYAAERLFRLTRKMLRDFPGVHRWEQTDDVFQNATLRLRRALGEVPLVTVAEFFHLAAAQIRRELIDLARRYSGPHGLGADHASVAAPGAPPAGVPALNPADTTHDPDRIACWTDFHREIEALPVVEREAFDLLFYQGLSQEAAAVLLDVSQRTIKRRWQAARLRLVQALGGKMPGI